MNCRQFTPGLSIPLICVAFRRVESAADRMQTHEAQGMAEAPAHSNNLHVSFGEFELNEPNALLLRAGDSIALAPTPFSLLCALVRRPHALLTKHVLLDEVWGHRFVSDSVLKGAISDVRVALGDDPQKPRYIETVPRRGYRFIAALAPASTRAEEIPYPAAASSQEPQPLFIGRKRELAQLARAWSRVAQGKRVVLWIAGEPGIGKTSLIDRFIAGTQDMACARGHCVQHFGSGEPYHPVLEALAELCRADTSVPALLREVAPTWLLQLPWLSSAEQREALLRELVGVNLERMLREIGEFLDRYTERRPLLLVTEDLHWGDRATIQLIDYIARRRGPGSVMWLASFRLAEIVASEHPLNALRRELHLHSLCEEIVLDSFSEAEIAAYLEQRLPAITADETMVRALHVRTEGVPLFVASLTGEVTKQSAQSDAAPAALLASTPVPENLFAIIDHHLGKLESERRVLLSAAAVCGYEFRIDMLALVLERDAMYVADVCDRLLREQVWIVRPPARGPGEALDRPYSFRHALFRQALYERLVPSVLAELHRKVGFALERQRSPTREVAAAELAMHFDRGRAPLAALRYYAEAAENALLHVSPAECMGLTERAFSLLDQAPTGEERTSLEISLATLRGVAALHLFGAGDAARQAYLRGSELLKEVPQHPMRALLLHGFGFLLNLRAEYAHALIIADRAESLGSDTADPLLLLAACTARAQAYMHQGRPLAAREWLERALPAAEEVKAGSQRTFIGFIADPLVTVVAMLSLPLTHLGRITEARECLQRAYARAHRLSQPMAQLITMWFDALCSIRLGDIDRVSLLADEMRVLVEKFSLAHGASACRWFRGWVDARRGKAGQAFHEVRAAFEQNSALGMIAGASETLGYAAESLILSGDSDGAEVQLRQAFDIVERHGERIYLPQLLLVEADVARARGQLALADASIRRAIAEAQNQEAPWLTLLAMIALCQQTSASDDDRRLLKALMARLPAGIQAPVLIEAEVLLG
jgi:DNA-binding winged helix-turn-helix (wHTH) protein/tetratricopeptide (TPR) repeat protein